MLNIVLILLWTQIRSFTHVGQAGNSAKMEKAGLLKLLEKVETLRVKTRSITTDRHQGVVQSTCVRKDKISYISTIFGTLQKTLKKLC